jgi:hypothetical protein
MQVLYSKYICTQNFHAIGTAYIRQFRIESPTMFRHCRWNIATGMQDVRYNLYFGKGLEENGVLCGERRLVLLLWRNRIWKLLMLLNAEITDRLVSFYRSFHFIWKYGPWCWTRDAISDGEDDGQDIGNDDDYDGIIPHWVRGVGLGVDYGNGEEGWRDVKLEMVECCERWPFIIRSVDQGNRRVLTL